MRCYVELVWPLVYFRFERSGQVWFGTSSLFLSLGLFDISGPVVVAIVFTVKATLEMSMMMMMIVTVWSCV